MGFDCRPLSVFVKRKTNHKRSNKKLNQKLYISENGQTEPDCLSEASIFTRAANITAIDVPKWEFISVRQ